MKIRALALILALVLMVGIFAACGTTGTCELCGTEGKVSTLTIDGESAQLCDDCKELTEGLADLADALS